jgi:ankyrin repeat protein
MAGLFFGIVETLFSWSQTNIHDLASRGLKIELQQELSRAPHRINEKDDNGATPLQYASSSGQTDVVGFLLQEGAEVNVKDRRGMSPFQAALHAGFVYTSRLLLEYGASVNDQNYSGMLIVGSYPPILWFPLVARQQASEVILFARLSSRINQTFRRTPHEPSTSRWHHQKSQC